MNVFNPAEPVQFTPEGPQPLVREIPDSAPYPAQALGPLCEAAEAIATITEAPIAMCAASVLAAAALATQGQRAAETLAGIAPASLFLLTVAESGERKSTADRLAMRGVRAFEADLRIEYDAEVDANFDALEVWKAQRTKILGDKKSDAAAKRADLKALGPTPPAPIKPHIVAGAPTIEGIVKHLPELRASLGIMTEEGGALIGGHAMKAENRLATCATFSAMWDGAPLDRWRAGDGVSVHTGRRFSAHLLVQPVAAEALLSDPMANGQGLLARFLTCRPPSHIGGRLRLTRDAVAEARVAVFADHVRSVLARPLPLVEGTRNEVEPPSVPLSHEARSVLTDFARAVEKAQAAGGNFETARAFASKTAEHAARIAAVMTTFADPNAATVTDETMADAVTLADYYATEAARLADAAIVPPDIADAERMRKWLLDSWAEDYISASVAAQRGPFKVTDRARKALTILQRHNCVMPAAGEIVDGKPRKEAWLIVREVGPVSGFAFDARAALERNRKTRPHPILPIRPTQTSQPETGIGGIGGIGSDPAPLPECEPLKAASTEAAQHETAPSASCDLDMWRHGVSVGGHPLTWTGRVVPLAEWHRLSDWERHGPRGEHWNGLTGQWEDDGGAV